MKSLKKGFTLVELMVVIVIIGILAALAIPRFLGATNKTKASEFKPVLKQLMSLQVAYKEERNEFTVSERALAFEMPNPAQARFAYSANDPGDEAAENAANAVIGAAHLRVAGSIKAVDGTALAANTPACIDREGDQAATSGAAAADLATVANVPVVGAADVPAACPAAPGAAD